MIAIPAKPSGVTGDRETCRPRDRRARARRDIRSHAQRQHIIAAAAVHAGRQSGQQRTASGSTAASARRWNQ